MTDTIMTDIDSTAAAPVHRNFFDQYADEQPPTKTNEHDQHVVTTSSTSTTAISPTAAKLLSYIHSGIIGRTRCIQTPYGWRRSIYADYTASGKPLSFIEDYMRTQILPTYANTHTLTSFTGLQTTLFRKEARDILARCMRASKDDVVLFTGSGSTAALKLLIHVLNISSRARAFTEAGNTGPHLVVLLGPYEHHSNLLPWREVGGHCVWVKEGADGGVDLGDLERKTIELAASHPHALRIGAFSAASNVSGILTDSISVSRILHAHGFMSVWDYASAAPYVEVDANPMNDPALAKDAIIVSTHKFIGGPGSCGALLMKKKYCTNRVPSTPGGGTVFFVTADKHRYLENMEEREEGGTPDILGAIRGGLAWQLKEQVGIRVIAEREETYAKRGLEQLTSHPNIVVMGHPSAPRLPIFSFLLRFPLAPTTYLHSSFVAALLNDLFGIQSRSGCLCAGPYGQALLGITPTNQTRFESALIEKLELLRPGFVRINLGWFLPQEEVDYILTAIRFLADHAWRFLPFYGFFVDSGEWKHRSRLRKNLIGRKWLSMIDYSSGEMKYQAESGVMKVEEKEDTRKDTIVFKEYLAEAEAALQKLQQSGGYAGVPAVDSGFVLPKQFQDLKWFVLPSEVMEWLKDPSAAQSKHQPCTSIVPLTYQQPAAPTVSSDEQKMDTSESSSTAIAPPSSFSLIAPATASHPPQPSSSPFIKQTTANGNGASSISKSQPETKTGQKRPNADNGPSKNQLKREAKKQRKENASSSAAASTPNGDESITPATDSTSNLKRHSRTDDFKEDVCKNCWHVHWNAKDESTTDTSAAASSTSSTSSTTVDGDAAKKAAHTYTKECTHCPCINYAPTIQRDSKQMSKVGAKIQKTVGRAIKDFGMIRNGDRVLIGISGGKDSLTLFHILRNLQRKAPVRFELGCVTVDPQTPEYDPSPLKAYFAELGVPYFYESQPILAMAKEKMDPKKQSICSFCSRMKRGVLYTCLRREKYNVLALGQHLDDLAESLLMSVFHNGMLRTMKANYHAEAGDIRIIRPLIYVRERLTREYANLADLPVINENCPACFEAPKERQRIKLLLASQEHVHPNLYSNMLQAMRPLLGMENYRYKPNATDATGDGDMDDGDGTATLSTSNPAHADLLKALHGISKSEEDEEDAVLDALCKAPGGKCALPTKKTKANSTGPDAPTSEAATTTASSSSSPTADTD